MKDEFTYRSTPDGSPPSGRKQTGTWKDISLSGADPKLIDEFDMDCQELGLTRFELANKLFELPENGGDDVRFYNVFKDVRKWSKHAERVKKRDQFGHFAEQSNDSPPEIT